MFASFSSGFGQAGTTPAANNGTGVPPYQPTAEVEPASGTRPAATVKIMAIAAMPAYSNFSQDELRWKDYSSGKKFGAGAPAPFGAGAPGAPSPAFGTSAPVPTPAFGAGVSASAFGANPPAPAFGAGAPVPGFGTAPLAAGFGANTPAASGTFGGSFGAPAQTFGAASAFGQPQPAAPSAFGAFGATQVPGSVPPTSTFGLGAPATSFGTSQVPGAAPLASAFGSAAPASSVGFGGGSLAPSAAPFGTLSAFGQTQPPATTTAAPITFGSFQAPAPAFGNVPTSVSFTAPKVRPPAFGITTSTTPFGNTATAATSGAFGSFLAPAPAFGTSVPAQPAATQATPSLFGGSAFGGATAFGQASQTAKPLFNTATFGSFANPTQMNATAFGTSALTAKPTTIATFQGPSAPAATPRVARIDDNPYGTPLKAEPSLVPKKPAPAALLSSSLRVNPREHANIAIRGLKTPVATRKVQASGVPFPPPRTNPRRLALETTPATPSRIAPIQSRQPEYLLYPAIEELQEMSDDQLRAVADFTVMAPGLGCVRWIEPVNLLEVVPSRAELSRITGELVVFRSREVWVYPDHSGKPPVGSGLNRPAIITLLGCYPSDKDGNLIEDPLHPSVDSHTTFLKEIDDTEFMAYQVDDGTWIFRVEHFSRYGLPPQRPTDDANAVPPETPPHSAAPSEEPASTVVPSEEPVPAVPAPSEALLSAVPAQYEEPVPTIVPSEEPVATVPAPSDEQPTQTPQTPSPGIVSNAHLAAPPAQQTTLHAQDNPALPRRPPLKRSSRQRITPESGSSKRYTPYDKNQRNVFNATRRPPGRASLENRGSLTPPARSPLLLQRGILSPANAYRRPFFSTPTPLKRTTIATPARESLTSAPVKDTIATPARERLASAPVKKSSNRPFTPYNKLARRIFSPPKASPLAGPGDGTMRPRLVRQHSRVIHDEDIGENESASETAARFCDVPASTTSPPQDNLFSNTCTRTKNIRQNNPPSNTFTQARAIRVSAPPAPQDNLLSNTSTRTKNIRVSATPVPQDMLSNTSTRTQNIRVSAPPAPQDNPLLNTSTRTQNIRVSASPVPQDNPLLNTSTRTQNIRASATPAPQDNPLSNTSTRTQNIRVSATPAPQYSPLSNTSTRTQNIRASATPAPQDNPLSNTSTRTQNIRVSATPAPQYSPLSNTSTRTQNIRVSATPAPQDNPLSNTSTRTQNIRVSATPAPQDSPLSNTSTRTQNIRVSATTASQDEHVPATNSETQVEPDPIPTCTCGCTCGFKKTLVPTSISINSQPKHSTTGTQTGSEGEPITVGTQTHILRITFSTQTDDEPPIISPRRNINSLKFTMAHMKAPFPCPRRRSMGESPKKATALAFPRRRSMGESPKKATRGPRRRSMGESPLKTKTTESLFGPSIESSRPVNVDTLGASSDGNNARPEQNPEVPTPMEDVVSQAPMIQCNAPIIIPNLQNTEAPTPMEDVVSQAPMIQCNAPIIIPTLQNTEAPTPMEDVVSQAPMIQCNAPAVIPTLQNTEPSTPIDDVVSQAPMIQCNAPAIIPTLQNTEPSTPIEDVVSQAPMIQCNAPAIIPTLQNTEPSTPMTRVHAAATPFAPRKNGSGRRILKSTATDVDYQDSNADDDAIAVTPALRNKSKNCNTESMVPLHFSGQENDADNEYPTTPRSTKKDKGKGRWTDPIIPSDPESTVDFTLYWHNGEVTSYWLDAFLRGDTSAPILEVYEHRKMIHGPRALFIPGAEFIPAGPRNSLPLYRAMDLVVLPEKMGEEEVEMLGGPEHFMRMVDLDYTMLPQCDNFANALHDQDLARYGDIYEDVQMHQVVGLNGGESSGGASSSGGISDGESIGGLLSSGESNSGESIGGLLSNGESTGGPLSHGESNGGQLIGGMLSSGESSSGGISDGESIGGLLSNGESNGGQLIGGTISSGEPIGGGSISGGISEGGSIGALLSNGESTGEESTGGLLSSGESTGEESTGGLLSSGESTGEESTGGLLSSGESSGGESSGHDRGYEYLDTDSEEYKDLPLNNTPHLGSDDVPMQKQAGALLPGRSAEMPEEESLKRKRSEDDVEPVNKKAKTAHGIKKPVNKKTKTARGIKKPVNKKAKTARSIKEVLPGRSVEIPNEESLKRKRGEDDVEPVNKKAKTARGIKEPEITAGSSKETVNKKTKSARGIREPEVTAGNSKEAEGTARKTRKQQQATRTSRKTMEPVAPARRSARLAEKQKT